MYELTLSIARVISPGIALARTHHHIDVYTDINKTKKTKKQKMLRQDFEAIFESRRAYGTAVSGVVIHLNIHLNHSQREQLV